MSGSVPRWERQRAAWLTGHSTAHGGALSATMRRRAEILERSARRSERSGSGITATAVQDEVSPGLWYRLTHDADGSRHHRTRWALAGGVIAVFAGPGLLVGHGIYRCLRWRAPRIGRLWAWPWAAVAVTLAIVLAVCGVGFRPGLPGWVVPPTIVHLEPWPALLGWQLVIAGLTVSALIVLWGWRGVPAKAVGAPIKNDDGSFREVPAGEREALDPWKGHQKPDESAESPEPESAYEKWEAEQRREAELAEIFGEPVEVDEEAEDNGDDDVDAAYVPGESGFIPDDITNEENR